MSEFNHHLEGTAALLMHERIERIERARLARLSDRRPRRSGRRSLARGLHSLADRLES